MPNEPTRKNTDYIILTRRANPRGHGPATRFQFAGVVQAKTPRSARHGALALPLVADLAGRDGADVRAVPARSFTGEIVRVRAASNSVATWSDAA